MNSVNNYVATQLTSISNTYQTILAFFYQTIEQTKYVNNALATYTVDYDLLLPSSVFISILTTNQVNSQIQAYVDQCDTLIEYITTTVGTQTNLFIEGIESTLQSSISNLSGFALNLLKAQYETIYIYSPVVDMSMSNILYLNNIDLDDYENQVRLNITTPDFNNIRAGTPITLSR